MTHSELDPVWNLLPHDLSIVDHILSFLPAPTAAFGDPLGPRGSGLLVHLGRAGEGAVASIHVSSNHPVNRRTVVVSGTHGVAALSGSYDNSLTVRVGKPGERDALEKIVPVDGPLPLFAELKRFLHFLRGGSPPLAPAEKSLGIVESIVRLRQMAGL